MKKPINKVLIIIIIIIAVLALAGGVFAYTYFCTDMLRTGQELFVKYLTQNMSELSQTVDFNKMNEIKDKLKQSKYEENITISYTEAEEANPIVELTIDKQNDSESKKNYGLIGLTLGKMEEPLKIEYATESDLFALRFTNAVKQFLSIKNEDLKQLATNLQVDEELMQEIPDKIEFEELSNEEIELFTEEEKNTEIDKYVSLVYNNISAEKYTKNKNAVITINGKTINTNSYVLTITNQDIKNVAIKLLEEIKQDEIILSKLNMLLEKVKEQDETIEYEEDDLKNEYMELVQNLIDELNENEISEEKNIVITIYEENKKAVRIKIEQDMQYITLDTTEVQGKKQIDLKYTNIDENNTQLTNAVTIIKENDSKLSIEFKTIEGEEQQSFEIETELIENENNIKSNFILSNEEGKFAFNKNISIVDEIDYDVTLDSSNNLILNDLSKERISAILEAVKGTLQTEYGEPLSSEGVNVLSDLSETQLVTILLGTGVGIITETGNSLSAVTTATALSLTTTLLYRYQFNENIQNTEINIEDINPSEQDEDSDEQTMFPSEQDEDSDLQTMSPSNIESIYPNEGITSIEDQLSNVLNN